MLPLKRSIYFSGPSGSPAWQALPCVRISPRPSVYRKLSRLQDYEMPSPLIERMKTLCSLPGPPGHEGAVRDAIAEMVKDSASELRRDGIGNLIACHEANEAAPHLLLECHMDEVGFIVTNVEAGGAIQLRKSGPRGGCDLSGARGRAPDAGREPSPRGRQRAERTPPVLTRPGTPRRRGDVDRPRRFG